LGKEKSLLRGVGFSIVFDRSFKQAEWQKTIARLFVFTGKQQNSDCSHEYHQAPGRIKHLLLLEIKIDLLSRQGRGDTGLAQNFTSLPLLASQKSSL